MKLVTVQGASRGANAIVFAKARHSYQSVMYRLMKWMSNGHQIPRTIKIAINDKESGHREWTSIGFRLGIGRGHGRD